MKRLSKVNPAQPNFSWDKDSPALQAKLRMVTLPTDESRDLSSQFVFTQPELWVPVAVVNGNVHILPGIPRLCMCTLASSRTKKYAANVDCCIVQALLDGLKPHIQSRIAVSTPISRIIISTPMPESEVAGYLAQLAARVEPKGVKVGSYPHWGEARNSVTLTGRYVKRDWQPSYG